MAFAGLFGSAAVGLCILYVVSFCGNHGAVANTHIGGPFKLVDDTGATVTEKTLAGKSFAIYFGYTYCPEVCPTTLVDLSRWIQKLGPDADKLNYVFVTVDPERDTVQLMHAYLSQVISPIWPRMPAWAGRPIGTSKVTGAEPSNPKADMLAGTAATAA
jgi:protein SCO1